MEYKKSDFPKVAKYKKPNGLIPFSTDFEDGEIVELSHFHTRPNSFKEGLAYYRGVSGKFNLINISKLEVIR